MKHNQNHWLSLAKEKCKTYLHYFLISPSLLILLFVIAFFASILSWYHPIYSTWDDIFILYDIKSGFPISFVSHILGEFLSSLYMNVSNMVPWYGIFLYISLGITLFTLLRSLYIPHNTKRKEYLAIYALITALYMNFIQKPGYTDVAVIAGVVGVLGFFHALYQDKVSWRNTIGYGLLLCLCFLWRTQALLFVAVFLFPVLLIRIRKYWKYCILFVLPCILLYTANTLFRHFQSTPEQKYYDEFNHYRAKLHDSPLYPLNKDNENLLQDVGWTKNDFFMYDNWIYLDENKYNLEKLKQVLNNPKLVKAPIPIFHPRAIYLSTIQIISEYKKWLIIIAFQFALLLLYCDRKKVLFCFSLFVYMMIGAILLNAAIKYPKRLGVPMLFFFLCMFALVLFNSRSSDSIFRHPIWKKMRIMVVVAGAVVIIAGQAISTIRNNVANEYDENIVNVTIEKIERIKTDPVLLSQAGFLGMLTYRSPLKAYIDEKFTIIPTAWPIFSPRFYNVLQGIGLRQGSEVLPYLIQSDRAFLICGEDMKNPIYIFIKENYNIEIEFKSITKFFNSRIYGQDYDIYKIQEKIKQE
jgi:hypothetical protein